MNILIKEVEYYKEKIVSFKYDIFDNELNIKNELTFKRSFDTILNLTSDEEIIQLSKKELLEFINHVNKDIDLKDIENIYFLDRKEAEYCSTLINLNFNKLRKIEIETMYNLLHINKYIDCSLESEFEIIKEFKYRF